MYVCIVPFELYTMYSILIKDEQVDLLTVSVQPIQLFDDYSDTSRILVSAEYSLNAKINGEKFVSTDSQHSEARH